MSDETINYTADDLLGLSLGDIVEVPSPFGPLTDEPVALLLESRSLNKETAVFRASMFGVFLGKATLCKTKEGEPKWQFT